MSSRDIDPEKSYRNALEERQRNHRFRTLFDVESSTGKRLLQHDSREYLNFCSNDYLGLSSHPNVIERSRDYTGKYGTGSGSSRLVSGSLVILRKLEEKIADTFQREACLLFGSGFQANSTLLPALTGRGDLILADKNVHNSLIHGAIASRATFRRYRHNDVDHLESILRDWRDSGESGRCLVVTESIFSMDGDRAPLESVSDLCKTYGALLMVDEAHAFGLYGKNGLGLASDNKRVDLVLGTFGKSAGTYGAFLLCSETIRTYLLNFCSGVIYTTAPAPPLVGAADAAMDLIPGMDAERTHITAMSDRLRSGLNHLSLDTGESSSQIIPIRQTDESDALTLSESLLKAGFYLQAIRPPTVKTSLLRISLCAFHTSADIEHLIETIKRLKHQTE